MSEVASVSKLKEYNMIATSQKDKLFSENKSLRAKFNEDILEAVKLEKTVTNISLMISEFLQILKTQSETVQDVHLAGKDATNQVDQTDEQLALTIQRTDSHSTVVLVIVIFFSFVLLFVDYWSS